MTRGLLARTTIIFLFSLGSVWAQQDPEGDPDSCYIVCGADGYTGSGQSEVCFQLRFHSDNILNKLQGILAPLIITGNSIVSIDTSDAKASTGSALGVFAIKLGNPDPAVPPFHMAYGGYISSGGQFLTGDSIVAKICLNISDTGTICIDTMRTETGSIQFNILDSPYVFIPRWSGPFCCQVILCEAKAGDANGDNKVNLVDIVYNVNYVFKGGTTPSPLCQGDNNADGMVNLIDIIYETNYVYRGGPAPLKKDLCCL